MTEREELEQAILALEAQRATLGDAVVDATLGALREKLAALDAARPDRQRKQVTILFMDVAGSTTIVRELDPEDNLAIMHTAMRRLSAQVARHGGQVTRTRGDGFVAMFGHPVASEHDPDNAIRAGLAIVEEARSYGRELEAGHDIAGFNVRVGINTGMIVVEVAGHTERTEAGAAINLAARLESAAEPGTLVISHDTYRHVRGVFDLQPLAPIRAKGFPDPVPIYRVLRAKSRSFRIRRRGVEGIETRLIGRESELKALQDAYDVVLTDGERQMVTIAGEAGLGKSRLLYEFENWVDLQPATVTLFRGRARQETSHQPYSLFRDLFAFRFGLQDDDSAESVRQKFVAGFEEWLADAASAAPQEPGQMEMKAHFAGHLLGYGFRSSRHIQAVGSDAQQLRDRAVSYLIEYFQATAGQTPVLVLLEDLHWADDSSLDLLSQLALALGKFAVLFVSAARPGLYQSRPHWMEGQTFHVRLDLRPLSRTDSRRLTREVLQKAEAIPEALRDLIVANAEGNPFFLEELVKMLIEEGVIIKREPAWQVRPERLAGLRVPPTLTGVLQARLDALPAAERTLLQRASAVGRVFWKQVVAYLNQAGETDLGEAAVAEGLAKLRDREMVFRRESSAFAGAQEHIFKHELLRDVAYESVLKRVRGRYHALAAEWLIQQSGERVSEFSGLIADHLELAGEKGRAVTYLRRAGEAAGERYAHEQAAVYYGRALALLPEEEREARYDLLLAREEAYERLGNREQQLADLERLEALVGLADEGGDAPPAWQVQVLLRRASYLNNVGDYPAAIATAEAGVKLAEANGLWREAAAMIGVWGFALLQQGKFPEAQERLEVGRAYAERAGARKELAGIVHVLGVVSHHQGEFERTRELFETALALLRETGARHSGTLNNLGNVSRDLGEYGAAHKYYRAGLAHAREKQDRRGEEFILHNLASLLLEEGDLPEARNLLDQALPLSQAMKDRHAEAGALESLGALAMYQGNYGRAHDLFQANLELCQEMGFQVGEAAALASLGQLALEQEKLEEAESLFGQAAALHEELNQPHFLVGDRAGLAQAALERGETAEARKRLEPVLVALDELPSLAGVGGLYRVLLTCGQVLRATGELAQAGDIVAMGYARLQARAETLASEAARDQFWSLPVHRELKALWGELSD
jgi:class 3 adenylate cyclase/tetratricopeptide (TPR) repeat protein